MSATDDNSAEASTGISKIIVSIDSINVPGLRFICKTLYEDEYEQLGASPRKRELLSSFSENDRRNSDTEIGINRTDKNRRLVWRF